MGGELGAKESNVKDPMDTTCLLAGLTGGNDESACASSVDSNGNACDFCSNITGIDLCLNSDQAQIAELVGGTCNFSYGKGKENIMEEISEQKVALKRNLR